jgi:hypothetical protein
MDLEGLEGLDGRRLSEVQETLFKHTAKHDGKDEW